MPRSRNEKPKGFAMNVFLRPSTLAAILATAFLCATASAQWSLGWVHEFGYPSTYYSEAYTKPYHVKATSDGVYVLDYGCVYRSGSEWDCEHSIWKYPLLSGVLGWSDFPRGAPWIDGPDGAILGVTAEGVYLVWNVGADEVRQLPPGYVVRKIDPKGPGCGDGNELWRRRFTSPDLVYASAVSATSDGFYVAGLYGADAYVRKHDLNGNVLWTRRFNVSVPITIGGLSVTTDGVYVTGSVEGSLPGKSQVGPRDAFVRKYDPYGNELWTRQFGGPRSYYDGRDVSHYDGRDVSATTNGVYISVIGSSDLLRRYDPYGNHLWTRETHVAALSATRDSVFGLGGYGMVRYDLDGNLLADLPLSLFLPGYVYADAADLDAANDRLFVVGTRSLYSGWMSRPYLMMLEVGATTHVPDTTPPVSRVSPLPATVSSPNFLVQWSGTDVGVGIRDYTIYVTDNGSPTTIWLSRTEATQAWYSGQLGHNYRFISRARDKADNWQSGGNTYPVSTQVPAVMPANVNGDLRIDCADAAVIKAAFGKKTSQPGFDPRADLNKDGIVDIRDVAGVTQKLAPTTTCP
jgi:hypothetical protein